jgi:hypothetical protein
MYHTTLRFFILSFVLFFSLSFASAQEYGTAIGFRAGSANGVSLKAFASEFVAFEGMAVYRRNGFRAVTLAEFHIPLGRKTGTSIYFGGGGHFGYNNLVITERPSYQIAGVDAIVGIEFAFPHSNMSLSLDVKPMYELINAPGFSGNNAGVTLRFF